MFRSLSPRRRVFTATASAAALLAAPAVAGAANFATKASPPPPAAGQIDARLLPQPPLPDPGQKIAVVLASAYGVEISDFVAPYEILGRSGAYQLYALASERKLLPFVNANMAETTLDFVPHFSFDEYDAVVGRTPDVIVVPWVPGHTPERDASMIEWIRAHAGPRTTLLTICAGTQILAETGLMSGHSSTTNVAWFDKLGKRFPDVEWVRGVRYHRDRNIIASTNVASGIDASLHAVDHLVGRDAALRVARELSYGATHYLDDPRYTPISMPQWIFGTAAPIALNAAVKWPRRELGVLLHDGVSELALGAILDLYTGSYSARSHVVAAERAVIRSLHGLTLVPRHSAQTAPKLTRIVLPGGDTGGDRASAERAVSAVSAVSAWSARRPAPAVEDIHAMLPRSAARPAGSVYDLTMLDLARAESPAVARGMGRALFYSFDDSLLV